VTSAAVPGHHQVAGDPALVAEAQLVDQEVDDAPLEPGPAREGLGTRGVDLDQEGAGEGRLGGQPVEVGAEGPVEALQRPGVGVDAVGGTRPLQGLVEQPGPRRRRRRP
jgi:hypothetical protein